MATERDETDTVGSAYQVVFERSPDGILIHDDSGAVLDANDRATELLDSSREQLRGQTLSEISPDGESALVRQAHERGSAQTEWHLQNGNSTHQVDVTVRHDTEDGGHLLTFLQTAQRLEPTGKSAAPTEDTESQWVSDQEQQYNTAFTWDKQLEVIVENLPVVLFALDSDGVFTLSEGKALAKLGLEPGEAVGMSIQELYADQPEILAKVERALEGEEIQTTATLGDLTFKTWYQPVTDEHGAVEQVIGVSMDITEQRKRQEELAQSEVILDQLTGTDDIVFWLFGGAFEELLFVNNAYEDVWGRSIADLRDDPTDFLRGVHPADRELVRDGVEQLASGESVDLEYRVNPEEDFDRWLWVRGNPLFDEAGDVEQVAGIARDITERKKHKQELEQSNKRLEQFAYVASHDLQEPLRTISNYTELLAEEYADSFDEDGERFVDVIVTGSERMQSMINGLLDYSRVTTRGSEFEPVDVETVVDETRKDLAVMLEEQDGTLSWGDLPTIEADDSQIRQVIQNLVKNALEHSDDEPVEIEIQGSEKNDHYEFTVVDDGPGIAENRQEKIFRIFKSSEQYQTSSQAKGIGLAICEQIVARHGGDIRVDSEPGEGARFVFTIAKEKDQS